MKWQERNNERGGVRAGEAGRTGPHQKLQRRMSMSTPSPVNTKKNSGPLSESRLMLSHCTEPCAASL